MKTQAEAHANAIRLRLVAGLPPFESEQESRPAVSPLAVLEAYESKTACAAISTSRLQREAIEAKLCTNSALSALANLA
jgi:hypothetical protein